MDEARLKIWETLFSRALAIIDSARDRFGGWSFGGGTVLMLRYQHRFSKDIDIFVPDPQHLGFMSPRLNDDVARLTTDYAESPLSLKLSFREGEIDFIASDALTSHPTTVETILGREVAVETPTEIVAKKVWHRGNLFKARDLFDFAIVAEREPKALREILPVLRDRRDVILQRMDRADRQLRADYAELEILDFARSYDECCDAVRRQLKNA